MINRTVFLFLIAFCLSHFQVVGQNNSPINVSAFNLRYDTPRDGENAWEHRKDFAIQLIRDYEFDIIGTQELLYHQIVDLLEMEEFAYTGDGRDGRLTRGEHSAIFFKVERFELMDYGDFWLSETPDRPSKGWDARVNRICSWAKLKDRESDQVFFVFNAHYDHRGVTARLESSRLINQKIIEIAEGYPVIFTGDLNAGPQSQAYMEVENRLRDSYIVTEKPPYGPIGTYHGFDPNAPFNSRILYVFVSEQFAVHEYGALTDTFNGRFPSDHLPVLVRVTLN